MFQRIKKYKVAVLAFVIWLAALCAVPSFYYDKTRELMAAEATAEYEAAVEEKYEELLAQYDQDLIAYQSAAEQYAVDRAEYDEYMVTYEQQCLLYNAEYDEAIEVYNAEMDAYRKAATEYEEEYNLAYASAYKEAEQKILKQGISFTVSVTRSMDYNHSVGHEWSGYGSVNGQKISNGTKLTLKLGQTIEFYAQMVEGDNVPDVGSSSGQCTTEKADFENGFTVTQEVIVRENRGRYSGNTAGFTFTYTFTPEPYTVVVDKSKLPTKPQKPEEPAYNPPIKEIQETTIPIEPTYPTIADTGIAEPDLEAIVVTEADVCAHFDAPDIIRVVISICAAAFILWNIVKTKKRLAAAKVEDMVFEEENFAAPEGKAVWLRKGMLTAAIICFVFALIYGLMSPLTVFLRAFTSFFGIFGIMFLVLAVSPKENPCLFGGASKIKKKTFVWICIIIAFAVVAIMANVISPTGI